MGRQRIDRTVEAGDVPRESTDVPFETYHSARITVATCKVVVQSGCFPAAVWRYRVGREWAGYLLEGRYGMFARRA